MLFESRRKPFITTGNLNSRDTKPSMTSIGDSMNDITLRSIKARTDYANRACNVTCNVMLVAKLVPRTADEPSAQRTASILRSLIDRTPFHRHRDECLCCKKSNSAHNICLSLIHTRRINNSTSFRFTAVILLTTS
jgi:hypothetical protein